MEQFSAIFQILGDFELSIIDNEADGWRVNRRRKFDWLIVTTEGRNFFFLVLNGVYDLGVCEVMKERFVWACKD